MRRKTSRKPSRRSTYARMARWFRYINVLLLLAATVFISAWAGGLVGLRTAFRGERKLVDYRPRLTTQIYSTERHPDGEPTHTLIGQVYKENRALIPLRDIPPWLRQATVAIEDHRFWTHRGISPRDMVRAAWINVRGGTVRQGASTITQQLVRNIWLSHARTWDRKSKEILLAIEVERCFSKQEILEMYLNEVYYGHGAYGIGTAAWNFFGKKPAKLTLGEAALLAGLPRAPAYYSPFNYPERAKRRRREVLVAMQRAGHITSAQVQEADNEQIQSALQPKPEAAGIVAAHAPHFTHLVIRMLCQHYGVDAVYEGGWRVYTTLDMRLQEIAEEELSKSIERRRKNRQIKGGLVGQGALACVDVHTGDVLAMVGGVGPYEEIQYNRAHPGPPVNGRQPGSSFKPYVWATALESGYGPNSVFSADPIAIRTEPGKYWRPKNYSPRQGGNYSLRRALARSVNLVSVRLVQKMGVKKVVEYAARMLDMAPERLDAVPALALGVSNVSPLEQASGYTCFARGGLRAKRRFLTHIENHRGEVIWDNPPQVIRVLRPATAISMISMLRSVVESGGTGTNARVPGVAVGGKTGTTQDNRDAWWVGFTPDLSAAVWVGNDDNSVMPGSSGGGFCAPIWQEFMKRAVATLRCTGEFPKGSGVVATKPDEAEREEEEEEGTIISICTATGLRATKYCPRTVERFFAAGEDLPGPCTKHTGPQASAGSAARDSAPQGTSPAEHTVHVTICVDSGKLATPFCPRTREIELLLGSAPTTSCDLHGPPAQPPKPAEPRADTVPDELQDSAPAPGAETGAPLPDGETGERR